MSLHFLSTVTLWPGLGTQLPLNSVMVYKWVSFGKASSSTSNYTLYSSFKTEMSCLRKILLKLAVEKRLLIVSYHHIWKLDYMWWVTCFGILLKLVFVSPSSGCVERQWGPRFIGQPTGLRVDRSQTETWRILPALQKIFQYLWSQRLPHRGVSNLFFQNMCDCVHVRGSRGSFRVVKKLFFWTTQQHQFSLLQGKPQWVALFLLDWFLCAFKVS